MLPWTISFDRLGIVAWSQLYIRISSSYLLIRGTCLALDPGYGWVTRSQSWIEPPGLSSIKLSFATEILLLLVHRPPYRSIYRIGNKCEILGEICRKRVLGPWWWKMIYTKRYREMEDGYERLEIRGFVFLFSDEIVKILVIKYEINGVKYGIVRVQ